MNLKKLFTILDTLLGSDSNFKGLTFDLDKGVLTVDFYEAPSGDTMFICDFVPESDEPISFAACGEEELEEQLYFYVLK